MLDDKDDKDKDDDDDFDDEDDDDDDDDEDDDNDGDDAEWSHLKVRIATCVSTFVCFSFDNTQASASYTLPWRWAAHGI